MSKPCSVIPCHTPLEIKTHFKKEEYQIFVIDDLCGKYSVSDIDIENWLNNKLTLNSILGDGKTKLLTTCRLDIYRDQKSQNCFDAFSFHEFNLSLQYPFSPRQKLDIARKYLQVKDIEILESILENVVFSPLICYLLSKNPHFTVKQFVNHPFEMFCHEWDVFKTKDPTKYCVLLLCVIFYGRVDESIFEVSDRKKDLINLNDLFEICRLDREVSKLKIKDKFDSCIGSYLKKEGKFYQVIHNQMFDFLCCYFGKNMISTLLDYADCRVLSEHTQLESNDGDHAEYTILLSVTEEEKFFKRVERELQEENVHHELNSQQMQYAKYRQKFGFILSSLNKKLIKKLMNKKDVNQQTAFIIVCLRGYNEIVSIFIAHGADVNKYDSSMSPLTAACSNGHESTALLLLTNNAKINQTDHYGDTPLYNASLGGYLSLVKILVENGAKMNQNVKYGGTPLFAACTRGHDLVVKYLIKIGVDINKTTKNFDSPLYAASCVGSNVIVKLLLDNGADANTSSICGGSPLYIASSKGHYKIVKMLIDKQADVNKNGNNTDTALVAACLGGYEKIVKVLIEHNANTNKPKSDGRMPLHIACQTGNDKIVNLLLDKEASVNMTYGLGYTPLYETCREGNCRVADILIGKGGNLNQATKSGETPLYIACREGHIDIARLLIISGADVNDSQNSNSETPLYVACANNHYEIVNLLLSNGADINKSTKNSETPFYVSCDRGYFPIAKFLFENKADIFQHTSYGWTPLYASCSAGYKSITSMLLEKGADVNHANSTNGFTILNAAISGSHLHICQLLITYGADVNKANKDGEKPIQVARRACNDEVLDLLIKNGADISDLDQHKQTILKGRAQKAFTNSKTFNGNEHRYKST